MTFWQTKKRRFLLKLYYYADAHPPDRSDCRGASMARGEAVGEGAWLGATLAMVLDAGDVLPG